MPQSTMNPVQKRMKICVMGTAGKGKTYSLRTIPPELKPYIISCDDGVLCLSDVDIPYDEVVQFDPWNRVDGDIYSIVKYIQESEEGKKHKVIVVDGTSRLQEMLVEAGRQEYGDADMREGWDQIYERMKALVHKVFFKLDAHVIFNTHVILDKDDSLGAMMILPDFQGKMQRKWPGFFHEIWRAERLVTGDDARYVWYNRGNQKIALESQLHTLDNPMPQDYGVVFETFENRFKEKK